MTQRVRVAVVEDHLLVRESLRSYLAREPDMEVVAEAPDAAAAYEAVSDSRPDVVVLDITLPGASGVTVARELLRRDPSQRIVFLSMHNTDFTIHQALSTGALGYVCKSQAGADLVTAIRAASVGRRYVTPIAKRLPENVQRGQSSGPLDALCRREQEVFGLIIQGLGNEAIARELCISRRTVETHRSNLLKKLGIHTLAELFRFAYQHGLLSLPSPNQTEQPG